MGSGARKISTVIVIAAFMLLLNACAKDKATQPLIDNTPACDTVNPSYKTCIQPIFISQCYACHSDSASENGQLGLDMENFTSLKSYLNNYYHNDSIYGSKFMAVIGKKLDVLHMPPSGPGLPDETTGLIQTWINNGAPDN